MNFLYISLGAVLGALSRYGFSFLWTGPWGIFLINIIGSFLIGLIAGFSVKPELRLFLIIGFLGAFTTFSSFSLDAINLLQKQKYYSAFLYICLSPLIGIFATFLGLKLSGIFRTP